MQTRQTLTIPSPVMMRLPRRPGVVRVRGSEHEYSISGLRDAAAGAMANGQSFFTELAKQLAEVAGKTET